MPPTGRSSLGWQGSSRLPMTRRVPRLNWSASRAEGNVEVEGLGTLRFLPDTDLVFDYGAPLPGHANGLRLMATDAQGDIIAQETYYSIGGGFVVTEAELGAEPPAPAATFPYPFSTAAEMLQMARASGKSIAQMKRANELAMMGPNALDDGMRRIWAVMRACIDRGLETDGTLPGGLNVKRRAKAILEAPGTRARTKT